MAKRHLNAAAPDMLAALKLAFEESGGIWVEECPGGAVELGLPSDTRDLIEDLIAKAEGAE